MIIIKAINREALSRICLKNQKDGSVLVVVAAVVVISHNNTKHTPNRSPENT